MGEPRNAWIGLGNFFRGMRDELSLTNQSLKFSCPICIERQLISEVSAGEKFYFCPECHAEYPVADGIPRFVDSDCHVRNFSFEWKIHRRTQMDNGDRSVS